MKKLCLSRDVNNLDQFAKALLQRNDRHLRHKKHTHTHTFACKHSILHTCVCPTMHLETNTYFAVSRRVSCVNAVPHSGLIRTSRALERYKCAESNGTERKLGSPWATESQRAGGIVTEEIRRAERKCKAIRKQTFWSWLAFLFSVHMCSEAVLYVYKASSSGTCRHSIIVRE